MGHIILIFIFEDDDDDDDEPSNLSVTDVQTKPRRPCQIAWLTNNRDSGEFSMLHHLY
jgi:hypothetical protein